MFTFSPIVSLVVVVGVIIYYALTSGGEKEHTAYTPRVKTKEELLEEEFRRQDRIVSLYHSKSAKAFQDEYARYIVWQYQHRDGKRPPTMEEVIEDYRKKKELMDKEREDKRLYNWWLFKHSDEYEKEMARVEEYLNR